MNISTLRRGSAAAFAVVALSASLAACGSEDDTNENANDPGTSESQPADGGESSDMGEGDSADPAAQTFGEGCSAIPTEGDGSFVGMAEDPVGTAASTNPVLKTLTAAAGAAGLVDVLNDTNSQFTVFAPYDDAFAELGDKAVNDLVKGATDASDPTTSPLAQILLHHVLGENDDPTAVVGEKTTANGDMLTIEGDESGMTVSDGDVTANVICGNIPTANATVYVIDKVLTGADVKGMN